MKLYQLTEQYHQALTGLNAIDLPDNVIADTLEGLTGDIQVKVKNVAAFILNREAEIRAVEDAAKKLFKRASAEQKNVDCLKAYLLHNMDATRITEISTPEMIIKTKNNPESVIVNEVDDLDHQFITEKITRSPNKAAIKEAIKKGASVKGAYLIRRRSLVIK